MTIAVPKFDQQRVAAYRDEKEGHVTLASRQFPERGVFMLNQTAKLIIDLCDGTRSLPSVYAQFATSFEPPISLEQARTDVNDALRVIDKLGLLDWTTGVNPFVEERRKDAWTGDSGVTYQVCGEQDLTTLMDWIGRFGLPMVANPTETAQHVPITASPTHYLEVAVRSKIFEYFELFVMGCEGDRPIGLVSITSAHPKSRLRVATVGLIMIEGRVADPVLVATEAVDYACRKLNDYSLVENTKVRAYLPAEDSERHPERRAMFEGMGFSYQVTLPDEMGWGAGVELWDRWLERSQ